jgi:adenine-specific DNA methylase
MLHRYLGNKNSLRPNILSAVGKHASPGDRVGDYFAGSMTVSLALKSAGYDVVTNDINHFSTTFGRAYVQNNKVPAISVHDLVPSEVFKSSRERAKIWIGSLRNLNGYLFLETNYQRRKFTDLLTIFCFLETADLKHLPSEWQRNDFFDTYCEEGRNSFFESLRGSKGNRRFFSPENARQIDTITGFIRYWLRTSLISKVLYDVLISSLIRAVEKVSNTQGTYHDFPRNKYDSRSLARLKFEAMPFDIVLSGGDHVVGNAEDSLSFALRAPSVDVLYLDPPYNFRQYTSYYFLPNLLSRYCEIQDLDEYFSAIQYVRGQNMEDDFDSPFCKKSQFISSLETLIHRARASVVVLSYFNGRNHWNDFKTDCNGQGMREIVSMFEGSGFESDSLDVRPIERLNYQSYGGHSAKKVDEYLFVAKVSQGKEIAMA